MYYSIIFHTYKYPSQVSGAEKGLGCFKSNELFHCGHLNNHAFVIVQLLCAAWKCAVIKTTGVIARGVISSGVLLFDPLFRCHLLVFLCFNGKESLGQDWCCFQLTVISELDFIQNLTPLIQCQSSKFIDWKYRESRAANFAFDKLSQPTIASHEIHDFIMGSIDNQLSGPQSQFVVLASFVVELSKLSLVTSLVTTNHNVGGILGNALILMPSGG